MPVLWAGSEAEDFHGGGTIANYTTTADRDTDFARAGVAYSGGASRCNRAAFGDLSEVWFHMRWGANSTGGEAASRQIVAFYNSSGVGVLRLFTNATGVTAGTTANKILQYWNGSTWVDIGVAVAIVTSTSPTIDIQCKISDTVGSFALYVDGVLISSLTGDTNVFTGSAVDYIEIENWGSTNSRRSSEHIACTFSTLGMRLATLAPNANGTNTAWTGTYLDIDETTTSDSDLVSSATANQLESFGLTDLSTAAALLTPVAVVTGFRGRNAATGPQNIQHHLRSGGADYVSANETGLTTSFLNGFIEVWSVDPATGVDWTISNINALEAGVKSIT